MQLTNDILNTYPTFKAKYGKKAYPIYWILIFSIVGIIVCLPLITVDVSSQSRGVIRSLYNDNKIVSVVGGRIIYVNLKNNQQVNIGDTLLIIDDNTVRADIYMQMKLVTDYSERLHDLKILCNGHIDNSDLKTDMYRQAFLDYNKSYSDKELRKEQFKRELERNKIAYDKGALSDVEYQQYRYQYESAVLSAESFTQSKLSVWREDEKNVNNLLISATTAIERLKADLKNYYITAPIPGTIISSSTFDVGSFVYAGQPIASLSPDDSLLVECYISPKDIGYIYYGQEVKLQYDAFDYNQWGLGYATVIEVDNNPKTIDNQAYFIVRCKIHSLEMHLKNGYTAQIKKGMTLTARFTITQRTLWQLLYDKVDDWLNPKILSDVEC